MQEENKQFETVNAEPAKEKKPKKPEIKVISPKRRLPSLIQEIIDKDFNVILTKDGYCISGFYGITHKNLKGYAFIQETEDETTMLTYDAKGHKHLIKTFNDLALFNNIVWGSFYKQEEYKKPDSQWFKYLLEFGILNIMPGNK